MAMTMTVTMTVTVVPGPVLPVVVAMAVVAAVVVVPRVVLAGGRPIHWAILRARGRADQGWPRFPDATDRLGSAR